MRLSISLPVFLSILFSCSQNKEVSVHISGLSEANIQTITINRVGDKANLASFNVADNHDSIWETSVSNFEYAQLIADNYPPLLLVLEPGIKNQIQWNNDKNQLVALDYGSKLLNYLWQSNNEFVQNNKQDIYYANEPETVVNLFLDLIKERRREIDNSKENLSDQSYHFLVNQNINRAFAYLIYYGKVIKDISPEDDYFRFLKLLDINDTLNYNMGKNMLYALEIYYMKKNKTLRSPRHFFDFIGKATTQNGPVSFYQALYLKELLLNISYWETHTPLLTNEMLEGMINDYDSNFPNSKYTHYFQTLVKEYYSKN